MEDTRNKLIKKVLYCVKTETHYLQATFKGQTINIFENQRYLIEWVLLNLGYTNNNFKELYFQCSPSNFHFYIFAYNFKKYVKSVMFSYWKGNNCFLRR